MKRIDALRKIIKERRLDGVVITKRENRQYLSGFTGSNATLILTAEANYIVTDFRYFDQAEEEAGDYTLVKPAALVEDAVIEQIRKLGLTRIGFEDESMSFKEYSNFKEKLPGVEFIALGQAVNQLRWVKDAEEIKAIRKAASIADEAFDHILSFIRPGVRESEISLELEYFMRRKRAQKAAFDTIIASGARAALPHGVASEKELASGEFIVIDFGAVYDGYHSDMTRTVIIGPPDEKQLEIYDLVLEAQKRAIEAIKPGVKCSDVDHTAREIIRAGGYGDNFGHGLGHSVGLEIHEKPAFTPRDQTILQPGMVITVEPGIYLTGWGGVRIEDLVLVTEKGAEILSRSPKHLIML